MTTPFFIMTTAWSSCPLLLQWVLFSYHEWAHTYLPHAHTSPHMITKVIYYNSYCTCTHRHIPKHSCTHIYTHTHTLTGTNHIIVYTYTSKHTHLHPQTLMHAHSHTHRDVSVLLAPFCSSIPYVYCCQWRPSTAQPIPPPHMKHHNKPIPINST